jgi:hypothetical protein
MITREPIYARLFDIACGCGEFATMSRKLKHWSDVPASQRPALFQTQGNPVAIAPEALGQATRWLLPVKLYIYLSTRGALSPGEAANPILDALDAAFAPHPARGIQTLGGLVQWARIEGPVETSEGTLGDDEVLIVPVNILSL